MKKQKRIGIVHALV